MTVITASDDGTVQFWKPLQVCPSVQIRCLSEFPLNVMFWYLVFILLQVQHFNTFQGHSAAVCGVVQKKGLSEFLSVSQDCTLRCWPLLNGNWQSALH